MPRLLALALTLLLWSHAAGSQVRAPLGDGPPDEHACAVTPEAGAELRTPTVGADPLLLETEPDRSSRMSEGRHASPAAAFRTVLQLAFGSEAPAEGEVGWRARRTIPVCYATPPPAPHRTIAR